MVATLFEQVRREAGLSQDDLATRAGTSRTTISAYEHGRKSPTMSTAARLLSVVGYRLVAQPIVGFAVVEHRGRPFTVPDRLWRLAIEDALAEVTLPLGLNWSRPGAVFRLSDRRERARCYEIVLREGTPADLLTYVDGALLVDAWPDLVLPRELRQAWSFLIDPLLP